VNGLPKKLTRYNNQSRLNHNTIDHGAQTAIAVSANKERFQQLLNFNLDRVIGRLHSKIQNIQYQSQERRRNSDNKEVRFSTEQDVIIINDY
jgi:hypothetical protein